MSRLSNAVSDMAKEQALRPDEIVRNFMGGDSYAMSPLTTLKMVTASSIFAEPSYYRDGSYAGKTVKDGRYRCDRIIGSDDILSEYDGKSTTQIMESAIDAALDFDFGSTLYWAVQLRNEYNMRLNPQIIMVRAALHPKRAAWTEANPGKFNDYQVQVMKRSDEPATQLAYFLYLNKGKKSNMPSILKRSIAYRLSRTGRYQVAKYKNHEIGMINAVRLTHAHSDVLDELMKTGTISVEDDQKTWENMRSNKKSWVEILDTVDMGHMAMLRNIRGVFEEINDSEFCGKYLKILEEGVPSGNQFPFRYWSAMEAITASSCNHKPLIVASLERCIDIAIDNMPKLKGKTMCLSDNSGSAWGGFTSEYGKVTVAEIDNLSSVITAMLSDEGYVGKFGDRLIVHPVNKRNGALSQAKKITETRDGDVGGATEGGIWEFFRDAINNKEHWDNIFIYSDQQAGTGGLYGTSAHVIQYGKEYGVGNHINVFKLVQEYRKKVNPKVNVFSVQTAGYDNAALPELAYRTHILTGWTGAESVYADAMIRFWGEAQTDK